MSHVVKIKTVLKDLEAVKSVCKELGLVWKENQKHYAWWGVSVGDYKLPDGFTKEDLGKCDHAIGIPGTDWEVGVVKLRDGQEGYTLIFDFFGSRGQPILQALGGEQAGKFCQLYGVTVATREAQRRGLRVVRNVQPTGVIRLQITGRQL